MSEPLALNSHVLFSAVSPDSRYVFNNESVYYYVANIEDFGIYSYSRLDSISTGLLQLSNGDSYILVWVYLDKSYNIVLLNSTGQKIYSGVPDQFSMVLSPDEQWICIQGPDSSTSYKTLRTVPMTAYKFQGGIKFTRDSHYVVVIGTRHIYTVSVNDLTVRTFDLPPEAENQPLFYSLTNGAYKLQSK
ncbi:hypothetical protein MHI24_07035 [Paenibacillus sp. FSL K6-1096]|uniref:hypothetical protein n=1 Tax=Paenibacillus sp. FSL K6-1096 TaxID=2921460 RepID=UPI0030EE997D